MALCSRFPAILLFLYAGFCKNKTASQQVHPISQKENVTPNALEDVSKKKKNNFESDHEIVKNDLTPVKESETTYKTTKNDFITRNEKKVASELNSQKETIEPTPTFTLKDITIQKGKTQSTVLETAGNTIGYSIKYISVQINGCYYTSKFGIDGRKKLAIPPSGGIAISLTPDVTLKAGSYKLKITIGKQGKGSRPTEQSLSAIINVIEEEVKKEQQDESPDIKQNSQLLNTQDIEPNNATSKLVPHPSQGVPHDFKAEPNATLEGTNIKTEIPQSNSKKTTASRKTNTKPPVSKIPKIKKQGKK